MLRGVFSCCALHAALSTLRVCTSISSLLVLPLARGDLHSVGVGVAASVRRPNRIEMRRPNQAGECPKTMVIDLVRLGAQLR